MHQDRIFYKKPAQLPGAPPQSCLLAVDARLLDEVLKVDARRLPLLLSFVGYSINPAVQLATVQLTHMISARQGNLADILLQHSTVSSEPCILAAPPCSGVDSSWPCPSLLSFSAVTIDCCAARIERVMLRIRHSTVQRAA